MVECIIPRKHHRTVIGAKGVNVQKLSKEYNVEIHFPRSVARDPRADVVVITGEEKYCLRVKEALLDLVPDFIAVELRLVGSIVRSSARVVRPYAP